MRGSFRANFTTAALVAGPSYLLQITTPATICVEILGATIGTTNNVTNQQLEAFFQRASVAGTGATSVTPSKNESGDQASGSTVGAVPTGAPTLTANTIHGKQGFASLAGWTYSPVPEERLTVPPSGIVVLILNTASFTSSIFDVEISYREIG